MDLNFHLLTSAQILKLQNISKFKCTLYRKKLLSFPEVREQTNVIIEKEDSDGKRPLFNSGVTEIIDTIRSSIRKEHDRRVERPTVDIPADLYEDWGDGIYGQERPINDNFRDDIDGWPQEVDRHVFEDNNDPDYYDSLIDEYSDALTNIQLLHQGKDKKILGVESYSIATNTDIRIMALELFRWKSKWLHSKNDVNASTGTCTLGEHIRYRDKTKKEDIFLFIDNIENEARAIGCAVDDLLEITFIHEMFHCYYSMNSKQDFIFMRSFHEIEEAMAEMGMIWLCKQYEGGRLFNLAQKIVNNKWNSSNKKLACYGLGERIYSKPDMEHGKMILDYQLIQRLFRYGNPDVSKFCRDLKVWNDVDCINGLCNMFVWITQLKANQSQHFYFDGSTTGENLTLIEYVLKYCATHRTRVPKYIFTKGSYQEVFRETSKVSTTKDREHFSPRHTVSNPYGTIISIWWHWNSGIDDNTIAFIDEIVKLYHLGWISDRITLI